MIITPFKSYPCRDKTRGHTAIGSNDMSHTKPKLNTTNGIRKTLAKQNKMPIALASTRDAKRDSEIVCVTTYRKYPPVKRHHVGNEDHG